MEPKFNFSFTYKQLFTFGLEVTRVHNKQIKQSDEIGVFWNLLEAMFDDDILIDKWHFNVKLITSLKTKQGIKNYPEGKLVLRFKFNAIAKLYAEQLRKRGGKPLPQDSLHHYLTTSKHFIGIESSCKFTRKDYKASEGKIMEQKQTTTAFCFDYNPLGINMNRESEQVYRKPVGDDEDDDDKNEKTTNAPEDDLPF